MNNPVVEVPGWRHDRIQDDPIERRGLPFKLDLFENSIPVINAADSNGNFTLSDIPLDSISPNHARSFEIGDAEQITGIWQDPDGNLYTSYSLKGNNMARPGIKRSATAPSGFMPWGLQEDDAFQRIAKASEALRRAHISTEWLCDVFEPSQLIFEGELVSQAEYKRLLIERALQTEPAEEVAAIIEAIRPMTFFVTARSMETNERIFDFAADSTPEEFRSRLAKVFKTYNILHVNDADYRELDAESEDDVDYYLSELLPRLRAKNLARLHNIGLVHRFPVAGNTHALGGIVDLDSVYGEPLGIGDPAITFADIVNDLKVAFESDDHQTHSEMVRQLTNSGIFEIERGVNISYVATMNFLQTYLEERGLTGSPESTAIVCTALYEDAGKNVKLFNRSMLEPLGVLPFIEALIDEEKDLVAELEASYDELFVEDLSSDSIGLSFLNASDEELEMLIAEDELEISDAFYKKLFQAGMKGALDNYLYETCEKTILAMLSERSDLVSKITDRIPTPEDQKTAVVSVCMSVILLPKIKSIVLNHIDTLTDSLEESGQMFWDNLCNSSKPLLSFDSSPSGAGAERQATVFRGKFVDMNTGISKEELLESISLRPDSQDFVIFTDEEEIPPEATNDTTLAQLVTDSATLRTIREIDSTHYQLRIPFNPDCSYIASISTKQADGKTYVIVMKNE